VSWEPELEELRRREELAQRMGGEERVARQHAAGRLDVRERLHRLFDPGSFHETGAIAGKGDYGADGELEDFLPANMLIGQGRIDGRRAVVQGDDFTVRGGAADAAIWQKMVYAERMAHDLRLPLVRLVDGTGGGGSVNRLPLVNLVDQPGFVIGTDAERRGTIRRGTRAMFSIYQASVPAVSVLVRKVFGVAGAAHGDHSRLNLRYAWPSGDWGSLPIEGGIEAAYRRDLEAAEDRAALREEIRERLDAVRSPFRTAERFGVEEIIDPRDTRRLLCDWAERAHELVAMAVAEGPKGRGLRT